MENVKVFLNNLSRKIYKTLKYIYFWGNKFSCLCCGGYFRRMALYKKQSYTEGDKYLFFVGNNGQIKDIIITNQIYEFYKKNIFSGE